MRYWTSAGLLSLLALGAAEAMACYTVYDREDRIVYHSEKPPVDMSRPLHETVPARFPGSHLVFDLERCRVLSTLATGDGGPRLRTDSPLLTDARTARSMRVPYKLLPRGAAVVAPQDAVMRPGLTVIPSGDGAGSSRQ